jgi:hypothetical protein
MPQLKCKSFTSIWLRNTHGKINTVWQSIFETFCLKTDTFERHNGTLETEWLSER